MAQYGSLTLPSRFRFRPRRFRTWLALVGGVLLVAAAICYLLARATPSWYQPLHVTDPDVDIVADQAQANFLTMANHAHWAAFRDETWSVTQDEINAFLAARFGEAAATQGSPRAEITDPMVLFTPGQITLCARSPRIPSSNPAGGVLSIVLRVTTVPPDPTQTHVPGNQVLVALDGLWIGVLPVPTSLIQSRVNAEFPALNRAVRQALLQQMSPQQVEKAMPQVTDCLDHVRRGEPFTADLTNDHGQKFALKEVRVTAGRFTLTLGPR